MNELLLFILIPFLTGIINVFLPLILRKIFTAISLLIGFYFTLKFYQFPIESYVFHNETIFHINSLVLLISFFIQLLSLIILIYAIHGVFVKIEKIFFVLYPLTVSFCQATVLSDNIISFSIFWGLSGLVLYLFATLGQAKDSPAAAKKTFLMIGSSDAFLLVGLLLLHSISPTQSWNLSQISIPLLNNYSWISFIFLLIAALTKAGAFPFHTWIPDFSQNSPVESVALLPASIDKLLGIYLIAKIMNNIFIVSPFINLILITIGALTVITGVMMALIQHNGYRLLGYHAVSQVGYMVMGVSSGNPLGIAGGLFHLINNTIYKTSLFLTLGSVEKKTATADLDNLGGIGKKMPYILLFALICALSISGIPPFNGFFSKWMIYQGLFEKASISTHEIQLWILVCLVFALFGSTLTLASFLKFLHSVFLGRQNEKYKSITKAPLNQSISLGLLSSLCILFGVFATELPLKYSIYPVTQEINMNIPIFIGSYNPLIILALFLSIFIIGILIYVLTAKIKFDEIYVGGTQALKEYRISGVEFYNEIRNFTLLKSIYNYAEKKYFDIYDLAKNSSLWISEVFQKMHPGQLQLYLIYLIIGFVIILFMM